MAAYNYVGEWVDTVDVFVRSSRGFRFYTNSEPATLSQEAQQKDEKTVNRGFFNMWPAPSVFVSAIALNVHLATQHLYTTRNTFIITYAETEDAIECKLLVIAGDEGL